MRWVHRVMTSDGVLHESEQFALLHANKRYGAALSTMAHRLLRQEKYESMLKFLDEEQNLNDIAYLLELKEDMRMIKEDTEDE